MEPAAEAETEREAERERARHAQEDEDEDENDEGERSLCQQHTPAGQKVVKIRGKLARGAAVCHDDDDDREASQAPAHAGDDGRPCDRDAEKSDAIDEGSGGEYRDSSGVDLHRFIVETLNGNPRDRMMLLKLEQDMVAFITGDSAFKKFPHMSSYHRMLVHRVAAFFGMEHNVDQTGKSVIINRTGNTRIPERPFLDRLQDDKASEIQQWKSLLKRDNPCDQTMRRCNFRDRQSRSAEEREEESQRARERTSERDAREAGPTENRSPNHGPRLPDADPPRELSAEEREPWAETRRRRRLFRGSRDSSGSGWTDGSRQSSTETDCRYGNEPRPWSSTDSDSSSCRPRNAAAEPRPPRAANPSREPRGSAGAISLFRVTPEPPARAQPGVQPGAQPTYILENAMPAQPTYVLENAIPAQPGPQPAYNLDNAIPPGSILVNPHTGQPFVNPDGSPVVYNPPPDGNPVAYRPLPDGGPLAYDPPASRQPIGGPMPTAPARPPHPQQVFSYAAPQMLAPPQAFPATEDPWQRFAQMAVNCQSPGEGAPLYPHAQGYVLAAPQAAPHGYCRASPQVPGFYYAQYPTSAPHPVKAASPGCSAGHGTAVGVAQQQLYTPPVAPHLCSMLQGVYQPGKVGDAGYCCTVAAAPANCAHAWTA